MPWKLKWQNSLQILPEGRGDVDTGICKLFFSPGTACLVRTQEILSSWEIYCKSEYMVTGCVSCIVWAGRRKPTQLKLYLAKCEVVVSKPMSGCRHQVWQAETGQAPFPANKAGMAVVSKAESAKEILHPYLLFLASSHVWHLRNDHCRMPVPKPLSHQLHRASC